MSIRGVFSERLKALRKEIGVSQEGLAESLGVARATLGYYEKGDRLPDIGFLDLVCKKTGCSVEYLMGYSDNMKRSNGALGSRTGLSDKAIEALEEIHDSEGLDAILNNLIEHPNLEDLLFAMKVLTLRFTGKVGNQIGEDYREYKLFQISKLIREICQAMKESCGYEIAIGDESLDMDLDAIAMEMEMDILEHSDAIADNAVRARFIKTKEDLEKELKRIEDREAQIEIEKREEIERAKTDPILRFRQRMERTTDFYEENGT